MIDPDTPVPLNFMVWLVQAASPLTKRYDIRDLDTMISLEDSFDLALGAWIEATQQALDNNNHSEN